MKVDYNGSVIRTNHPTKSQWPLYHYRGVVDRIVDGDTIQVLISLGCHAYTMRRVRLLGYNAPEVVGVNRAAGLASASALEHIIPVGSRVYLETYLDRASFDRLLAHVYAPGSGDELLDVAAAMIAGGHGVAA